MFVGVEDKRGLVIFLGGVQRAKKERKVGRRYRGRSRRALRDAGNIEFPVHGCLAAHDVFLRRRTIRNDTGGATIVKRS